MFGHTSFSEAAFSDVGIIVITTPSFRQVVFVSQELPRKVLVQRKVAHVVVIPQQNNRTVNIERQQKREVMINEDAKRKRTLLVERTLLLYKYLKNFQDS